MSGDLPPHGPPSGPPGFGPPSGPPPAGPPPSGPPPGLGGGSEPTQGPWGAPPPQQPPTYGYAQPTAEFLDSAGGLPPAPPGPPGARGGAKRRAIIAGGAVVGLAAVAGGAFAAYNFLVGTGPQPAEALPASTVGYVSVDLDPSNKQKIEALDALHSFPAFADNVDLSGGDDLRKKFFEMIQDDGACSDLDYAADIEPWLGDRLAVAGVDLGAKDEDGDPTVSPMFVVQVKDADAANDGLASLSSCGSGDSSGSDSSEGVGGWAIRGEWAVIAETEDLAKQVSDAAASAPLSEDDDFEKWTDEAGGDGIATAYVSSRVVDFLPQALSAFSGTTCYASSGSSDLGEVDSYCDEPDAAEADQVKQLLQDFEGLAVKVRFSDGAIEIETAGSTGDLGIASLAGGDQGGEAIETLPADTAVAYGIGLQEGWFQDLTDYVSELGGDMAMVDEGLDQLEAESGLDLPDDIETLLGESIVVSLGSDVDLNDTESPSTVPFGAKVKGDPDAISGVLDKLVANGALPPDAQEFLGRDSDGDFIAIGPNSDYRQRLLDDGGLGDSDTYRDVVPESDRSAVVVYVNFDANDWLVTALREAGAPAEIVDNVEPLQALGISGWTDGDVSHALLRLKAD